MKFKMNCVANKHSKENHDKKQNKKNKQLWAHWFDAIVVYVTNNVRQNKADYFLFFSHWSPTATVYIYT